MQRPHAGWNTIPPQDKNHKLWMNKAAAVSEAKSDEEGSREESWGGEEKERRLLILGSRKGLLWAKRQVTKKPPAEQKPTEKKPTTEKEAC